MLRSAKYYHLSEDEVITNYEFGDSLHIRYMIFFTSRSQLLIIAESKYDLERVVKRLDWFPSAPPIQMKYQADQYKLHLLTQNKLYIVMTLSSIFQSAFTEKWQYMIAHLRDSASCSPVEALELFKLKREVTLFMLGEHMIVSRKDTSCSTPQHKQMRFDDFVVWPPMTIFVDKGVGSAIFFDATRGIIVQMSVYQAKPHVYKMQATPLQMLITQNKEAYFLSIRTQQNDVVMLCLSRIVKGVRESILDKYDQVAYRAKVYRYPTSKCVFFSESLRKHLLFTLAENVDYYSLSKYKLTNLDRVKKVYNLRKDNGAFTILAISDIPKRLVLMVQQGDAFRVLCFSKLQMLQEVGYSPQQPKSQLFPQHLEGLLLVQEDGVHIESQLQRIMSLSHQQSALLFEIPFKVGERILHMTPFTHHFKNKMLKTQLMQSLTQRQESAPLGMIDSIINKSVQGTTCVIILSQRVDIIRQCETIQHIPKPLFSGGFKGLKLHTNLLSTFSKLHDVHADLDQEEWQLRVLMYLWCKINYENGIEPYCALKNRIHQGMNEWVDSITRDRPTTLMEMFQSLNTPTTTPHHNQFEKCFSTMALLSTNFISSDRSIDYIIKQVYQHTIPKEDVSRITSHYVERTGSLLMHHRDAAGGGKCFLSHSAWKDKQQYLSVCLILFELNFLVSHQQLGRATIALDLDPIEGKIDQLLMECGIQRLYYVLMSGRPGRTKLFTSIIVSEVFAVADLQDLLTFALTAIKILDAHHPTFNIRSLVHLHQLNKKSDLLYLSNLLSIWESHYTRSPPKQQQQNELHSLEWLIGEALEQPNLQQDGLLMVMLMTNKLGLTELTKLVRTRCSRHVKWIYDSSMWLQYI